MDASLRLEAGIGAGAGLLAGLAVGVVLAGQGRLDMTQPLRADPPIVGWLAFLAVGATGGALYGALYRLSHRPEVGVTLVSENNFLLFTPMLAGVASGSLVPRKTIHLHEPPSRADPASAL